MTTRRKILTAVAASLTAASALAQRPDPPIECRDMEAAGEALGAIGEFIRDPTRNTIEMISMNRGRRRVISFTVVLNDPVGW